MSDINASHHNMGENGVYYDEHPSMFRNHPFYFIITLILCVAGIGLIIFIIWYLNCKSTRLVIDCDDVLFEKGLIAKDRTSLKLSSVRAIKINQSVMQRIFGVGKILIYSSGDNPEIEVTGMPNPNEIREIIDR